MTPEQRVVRHLNTPVLWPAALTTWLVSLAVFLVTAILSVVGLLLNFFSVGHYARDGLSWGAFESPAPSMTFIFIVLGAAWLAFSQGWCFIAGAAFKSTYKRAYIWNASLNIALIAAVVLFVIVSP